MGRCFKSETYATPPRTHNGPLRAHCGPPKLMSSNVGRRSESTWRCLFMAAAEGCLRIPRERFMALGEPPLLPSLFNAGTTYGSRPQARR